jgi:hypothetical protein
MYHLVYQSVFLRFTYEVYLSVSYDSQCKQLHSLKYH